MNVKLTPQEAELYKRCDEVLYYIWDPIGISDNPTTRDEYQDYLPQVFELVRGKAEPDKIESRLAEIMEKQMMVPVDHSHNEKVASLLIEWRNLIWEDPANPFPKEQIKR